MASTWRTIVGTAAVTVPITVTMIDMIGYVAKVEGASMQPSLNPKECQGKDYVFLNRWAARTSSYKPGDVVSLKSPTNPDQKLIKRVIAIEGDTIKTLSYKNRYVKVAEGHCWVEGDHHGQSLDSNLFGPVAMALITAKASHIVWPPNRWQKIKPSLPDNRINVQPVTPHTDHADHKNTSAHQEAQNDTQVQKTDRLTVEMESL